LIKGLSFFLFGLCILDFPLHYAIHLDSYYGRKILLKFFQITVAGVLVVVN